MSAPRRRRAQALAGPQGESSAPRPVRLTEIQAELGPLPRTCWALPVLPPRLRSGVDTPCRPSRPRAGGATGPVGNARPPSRSGHRRGPRGVLGHQTLSLALLPAEATAGPSSRPPRPPTPDLLSSSQSRSRCFCWPPTRGPRGPRARAEQRAGTSHAAPGSQLARRRPTVRLAWPGSLVSPSCHVISSGVGVSKHAS